MSVDPSRYWEYVQKADWELAIQSLNATIDREPTRAPHYANRAVCLLALHMLEEALNDYCKASQLNTKVDAYPIKAGVILWWLGRAKEAIETWRGAIDLQYTDPAGGITIPALLLFAGVKQGEIG